MSTEAGCSKPAESALLKMCRAGLAKAPSTSCTSCNAVVLMNKSIDQMTYTDSIHPNLFISFLCVSSAQICVLAQYVHCFQEILD